MEFLAFIALFPAIIFLDLIPRALNYKGLFNWYAEKNGGYANEVLPLYIIINLIILISIYLTI